MVDPERVQQIIDNKGVRIPRVAQDAHFWIKSQDSLEEARQKEKEGARLKSIREELAKVDSKQHQPNSLEALRR